MELLTLVTPAEQDVSPHPPHLQPAQTLVIMPQPEHAGIVKIHNV
jgi:hypothetical protein